MSKITKLLVLLLALVMVVSLFAGCTPVEEQPKETTTTPTTTTQGTEGGNEQTSTDATIENGMFPLAKPITFRVGIRGHKDYQLLIQRCEWYQYLCEKTNVFIECVILGDDYMTTLETLINTNYPPDVVLGPDTLSSSQIMNLAEQGKLQPLEELMTDPEIMPNYQRALQAVPEALKKATTPDGHIWSFVGISEAPSTAWDSPLSVNIAWLKQVPGYEDGKTFPKTVEEFTEVLRYFKKNDMNGNGNANDEIPFLMVSSSDAGDAQGTLQGLMNLWGLSTTDSANEYYISIQDDGACALAPQTQNYRDCLKWVNIWWQEGLIWEKFFDDVSAEEFAAVSGAETASWGFFNGAAWYNNGAEDNGKLAWRDDQTLVVPFNTGYDVRYFMNPAVYGNLNGLTVFKNCKSANVLMAWLDQFFALTGTQSAYEGMANEWERWDDSADYKAYYEKNPTWSVDKDGNIQNPAYENASWVDLNTFDSALANKKATNHPVWADIFDLHEMFLCITPDEHLNGQWKVSENSEEAMLGQFMQEHPEMFDHKMWLRPYTTENDAGELNFLWSDIKEIITKYETGFIKGQIKLDDANWNAFQQELEYAGVKDLVMLLQSMWDRMQG